MPLESINSITEDPQREVETLERNPEEANWVLTPESVEWVVAESDEKKEKEFAPVKMGIGELFPMLENQKTFAESINEVEQFAKDPRLEDIQTQLELILAAAKMEYMDNFQLRLSLQIDEEKRKKDREELMNSPFFEQAKAIAAKRRAQREAEAKEKGIELKPKEQTPIKQPETSYKPDYQEIDEKIPAETLQALQNTNRVWTANATVDSRLMLGAELFGLEIPESIQVVQEAARRYLTREDNKEKIETKDTSKANEEGRDKIRELVEGIDQEKRKRDVEALKNSPLYAKAKEAKRKAQERKEQMEKEKANT